MQTIDLSTLWTVNKKEVKSIEVQPIGFAAYANLITSAFNSHDPATTTFDAAFRTAKMLAQSTLVFADGTRDKMEYVTLVTMPVAPAMKLSKAVETRNIPIGDKKPEKVGKGNGIDEPVIIKLSTPIATGSEGKEYPELEFLITNYGDVEAVLGEANQYKQTMALITKVARDPASTTGMPLPSWAVDQILLVDGLFIMEHVTTPFLDLGEN